MTPLVEIKQVTKRFGGLIANNDITFNVFEGEILSVIGPNGAGKSTLFKIISSFLRTTAGEVRFRGERISNLRPHIVARKGVVRTFQETTIFKQMTVRESVVIAQHLRSTASLAEYFAGTRTAKRDLQVFGRNADRLLEFFGLEDIADEVASNLPHGHLRALGIAVGLATDPAVLLLDEPFSGMNRDETTKTVDLVRKVQESGVTVLLVEHDMPAVMSVSDRIVVLNFGELIAEGTPSEIRGNERVVEAYLGREDDSIGL